MKIRFVITAFILMVSITAQSQIFGKIIASSYSTRGYHPEYKESDHIAPPSHYFDSNLQAKNIQRRHLFHPILIVPGNRYIYNPIWVNQKSHLPRYVLENIRGIIPEGFLRAGTYHYNLHYVPASFQ